MGVYFSGSVLKVTLVFNYEKEMFCESLEMLLLNYLLAQLFLL